MAANASSRWGLGCLTLFATPFVLAGVLMISVAIRDISAGSPVRESLPLGIGGAAFLIAGLSVLAIAVFARRTEKREAALHAQYPGKPWMWDAGWASGRIPDQTRNAAVGFWLFAIVWNAIAIPMALAAYPEIRGGNRGALIAMIFPLVGIVMLVVAIRATLRRLRFRSSVFALDSVPARPGSTLRGTVEIAVDRATFATASSITLTLSCIRRVITGSGKSRSVSESTLWEKVVDVAPAAIGVARAGTALPVSIGLPDDAPTTMTRSPSDSTLWRLDVAAKMPGVDYASRFELPVFAAGELATASIAPETPGRSEGMLPMKPTSV